MHKPSPLSTHNCHLCEVGHLEMIDHYQNLCRVTSDCKPWPAGGRLGFCQSCGAVQKPFSAEWEREIAQIYNDYTIYHQSAGTEQTVHHSGQMHSRSAQLLERLEQRVALPQKGRLLDIGCGNGALLNSFSQRKPEWSLTGTELNDTNKAKVESIPRVDALYTCAPEAVPGQFDVITMIHLLEHIPSPKDFLATVRPKLAHGGLLIIEVPNHRQNPFDLLIADHATHFSLETLTALIVASGYEIVTAAEDWIPKELTLVARPKSGNNETARLESTQVVSRTLHQSIDWLDATAKAARECSKHPSFGLFGTSIAGTWLFHELRKNIEFFVDEDPTRTDKRLYDIPVIHPNNVSTGSHVYIGLAYAIAASVFQRLNGPGITYHLPPIF